MDLRIYANSEEPTKPAQSRQDLRCSPTQYMDRVEDIRLIVKILTRRVAAKTDLGLPHSYMSLGPFHYKTRLFKYIENFTTKKGKFSVKNSDIYLISASNISCVYSLEPPRRGGSNEYPQFMFSSKIRKTAHTL